MPVLALVVVLVGAGPLGPGRWRAAGTRALAALLVTLQAPAVAAGVLAGAGPLASGKAACWQAREQETRLQPGSSGCSKLAPQLGRIAR
jgi:hypothetical protein